MTGATPTRATYQVRVHVIEARQLKPAAPGSGRSSPAETDALCDPICTLRLKAAEFDQVKTAENPRGPAAEGARKSSVLWDQNKIFQVELSPEQFAVGRLELDVSDAGAGGSSSEAIGSAQFDLLSVYDYEGHEVYGTWIALLRDGGNTEVRGYLRVSVVVLKEGDAPKSHALTDLPDGMESLRGVMCARATGGFGLAAGSPVGARPPRRN